MSNNAVTRRRRMTDGERISTSILHCGYDEISLAARIDRLIRRRMASAWDEGWELGTKYGDLAINRYRGRKKK